MSDFVDEISKRLGGNGFGDGGETLRLANAEANQRHAKAAEDSAAALKEHSILQNHPQSFSQTYVENLTINQSSITHNNFNDEDRELIRLIESLSETNRELIKNLKILKDASTEKSLREKAQKALLDFLAINLKEIGETACRSLSEYINNLIGN